MVPRILVVDDDERLLDALARALTALGFEVTSAVSVDAAIKALASGPAAVITDLELAGRRGTEVIAHVEAMPRRVPVIVISGAFGDAELVALRSRASVRAVLDKPFALDTLVDELKRALDERAMS